MLGISSGGRMKDYPVENLVRVALVLKNREKLERICAELDKHKLLKADLWYGIGDNSIGMQKISDWLEQTK